MLAFVLGLIAERLRGPPLGGYLQAGVMAAPHTPGFNADPALAAETQRGRIAFAGLPRTTVYRTLPSCPNGRPSRSGAGPIAGTTGG